MSLFAKRGKAIQYKSEMKHKALVCATKAEAQFVVSKLFPKNVLKWQFTSEVGLLKLQKNDVLFHVVITGVGPNRAFEAIEKVFKLEPQISEVVVFGFCGGLVKTVRKGDLSIPQSLYLEGEMKKVTPTAWLRGNLKSFASGTLFEKMLTTKQVVSTAVDKAALYAATDCHVVDMESAVVGKLCDEKKIPWAVIKTVLDGPDEPLSEKWAQVLDVYGRVMWKPFLTQILLAPGLWPEVSRMMPYRIKKLLSMQVQVMKGYLQNEFREHEQTPKSSAIVGKSHQFSLLDPA